MRCSLLTPGLEMEIKPITRSPFHTGAKFKIVAWRGFHNFRTTLYVSCQYQDCLIFLHLLLPSLNIEYVARGRGVEIVAIAQSRLKFWPTHTIDMLLGWKWTWCTCLGHGFIFKDYIELENQLNIRFSG